MSDNDQSRRPLAKELTIVIMIAVFVIYLIAGGLARQHGYFDSTIMYDLFPAMALGYVSAFIVGTGIAHYYPDAIPLWFVSGVFAFVLVTAIEMTGYRWGRRGLGSLLMLIILVIRGVLYIIEKIYNRS